MNAARLRPAVQAWARRVGSSLQRGWRNLWPKSLQYQLLTRTLLILCGLLCLIGVFQYVLMSKFLYGNTAQTIRSQIWSMPQQMWSHPLFGRVPDGDAYGSPHFPASFTLPDATVSFIDTAGNYSVVNRPMDMDQTESPPIELPAQDYEAALAYHTRDRSYQVVTDAAGTRQLVVLVPVGPPDLPSGVVQVTMPVRSLQHMLVQQLLIFVVLAAVAVVAAVVTLLPTVRRTLVPLARVVHSASRVNAGNLDERVTVAGAQTEVATLAKSFNDMLDRLQQAFEAERAAKEKMRTFVADASHELRTPLTSIHGFLEVLLRGAAKQPEQLERALKSMLGESQRLTKLVQDLLTLARLDQTPGLLRAPCDLADILRDMQPQLALLAGEREVALELPASAAVLGDKDKLKQVVLNLFQNAVQHTSAETGRIAIVLRDEDTGIRLEVKDNGEGIPPDRMAHIFERFYRVDSARSRKHGGAGLGLSISQAIVQAHGGTIACESAVGEGTVFTVWLPKQASA